MKKIILLLFCLGIFSINICGCQNSPSKEFKNTTNIVIGYGFKSYVAVISDKDEVKQLEDLFKGAELNKSDASIHQPYLSISFYGEKSINSFYIDDKDIIQLSDGNYMKSKQITFEKLYSIYNKYLSEKK